MASYNKHYDKNEHYGICAVKHEDETNEELFKRFRKKFSKSGLSKEMRDRMFYEKPCDKRRRKKTEAIRLMQREEDKISKMRARYNSIRAKKKKEREKQKKYKETSYDKRSSRQNSGGISKNDNN